MTCGGSNPTESACPSGSVRMSRFVSRALLLLLVARMAIVPPMRPTGRPDHPPQGRVLLRYCAGPAPLRWSHSVAAAGGNDPGAAAGRFAAERGPSPAGTIPTVWPLVAPSTPRFLLRPPSH